MAMVVEWADRSLVRALILRMLISALLLAGPNAASADGDAKMARIVQEDARKIAHAAYAGDVDVTLQYTPQELIDLLGGRDQARVMLGTILSHAAAIELKLQSLEFPAPPQFISGQTRRFVIVPTLNRLTAVGGQRFESLNFLLGVLEPGAAGWKYVDGSRIKIIIGLGLFPDLPPDVQFPQIYRKKL